MNLKFYHRQECHLCEDMRLDLESFKEEEEFEFEAIDIDSSSMLRDKYGTLIPVLAAGDEILCNYYLDPMSLRAFLKGTKD